MIVRAASDYYSVLGVERNADKKQIKQAYRQKARKFHPVSATLVHVFVKQLRQKAHSRSAGCMRIVIKAHKLTQLQMLSSQLPVGRAMPQRTQRLAIAADAQHLLPIHARSDWCFSSSVPGSNVLLLSMLARLAVASQIGRTLAHMLWW
jgi:hypothetical protein